MFWHYNCSSYGSQLLDGKCCSFLRSTGNVIGSFSLPRVWYCWGQLRFQLRSGYQWTFRLSTSRYNLSSLSDGHTTFAVSRIVHIIAIMNDILVMVGTATTSYCRQFWCQGLTLQLFRSLTAGSAVQRGGGSCDGNQEQQSVTCCYILLVLYFYTYIFSLCIYSQYYSSLCRSVELRWRRRKSVNWYSGVVLRR